MSIKDNLVLVAAENAEALLDGLTDNELVKEIPVINTVVGLAKTGKGVSDYLFAKKINVLLVRLDEAKAEDKQKVKVFAQNGKNSERLAEHILNSINKMADKRKAEIIANLFLGYLNEKIDESSFRRALEAIDSIFIDDLLAFLDSDVDHLKFRYDNRSNERNWRFELISSALLEVNAPKLICESLPPGVSQGHSSGPGIAEPPTEYETSYRVSLLGKNIHSAYEYGKESRSVK